RRARTGWTRSRAPSASARCSAGGPVSSPAASVLAVFDELNAVGRTIVLITHEDEVGARADRLIKLFDGRVTSDSRQERSGRHAVVGV
ncbi:hypothetical protein AB0C31_52430, partial [Actinoplanes philippinensis]